MELEETIIDVILIATLGESLNSQVLNDDLFFIKLTKNILLLWARHMFPLYKNFSGKKSYLPLLACAMALVIGFTAPMPLLAKSTTNSHSVKHKNGAKHKNTVKRKQYARQHAHKSYKPSQSRVKIRRAQRNTPPPLAQLLGLNHTHDPLDLHSSVALVMDQQSKKVLFEKNSNAILPIASITKLMTALVVLDAQQPMNEFLQVGTEDRDTEKGSSSRLWTGMQLSREEFLLLALMASENRAAFTLASNYPGGRSAFIAEMNRKAHSLDMTETFFADPTGLDSRNVSSAADLAKLVNAAYMQPIIRDFSTRPSHQINMPHRVLHYVNTNRLIRAGEWDIGLQKTGYISEAGRCLVMQATVQDRPVVMVFLASAGIVSRFADALRIRHWLEKEPAFASHVGQL